jgi:hypothetical protein
MESVFHYKPNRASFALGLDHFPIAIGVSGCGIDDANYPFEASVIYFRGIGANGYEWNLVLF